MLFNPFPDDAIVDVSLSTEPGGRDEPGDLRGLPVEAGTTSVVDVGQFVRLRDRTSISVVARSGRLVVDRVQSFDGSEGGRLGLSLMLASPGLAESWAFPAGEYSASTTEQWHVYNPSGEEAVVDLHLVPDEGQSLEPVSLTVPPLGRVTVDAAAIARVPADVGHSSTVRSVNRVAVVVERELDARPPSEQPGWTSSLGAPQAASRWVQTNGAGRADELVGQTTVIYNPGATAVMVAVANLDSATQASPRRVELDPAERVVLDATRSLLIEADGLVIVERVLARSSGPATSIAIPV